MCIAHFQCLALIERPPRISNWTAVVCLNSLPAASIIEPQLPSTACGSRLLHSRLRRAPLALGSGFTGPIPPCFHQAPAIEACSLFARLCLVPSAGCRSLRPSRFQPVPDLVDDASLSHSVAHTPCLCWCNEGSLRRKGHSVEIESTDQSVNVCCNAVVPRSASHSLGCGNRGVSLSLKIGV